MLLDAAPRGALPSLLLLAAGAWAGRHRTLCPQVRDGDVAFAVDVSAPRWRARALNANRTYCGAGGAVRGARKLFSVGMPATGADGAVARFLAARKLRVRAADESFLSRAVDVKRRDRDATFFDGAAGADAFAARARRQLGAFDAAAGLALSQFAHELLSVWPDGLVVASARNVTAWLAAARDFPGPGAEDRAAALLFGAAGFDAYLAAKRYVDFYAALLRRVPCCQLLVVDVGDAAWEARLGAFLKRRGAAS